MGGMETSRGSVLPFPVLPSGRNQARRLFVQCHGVFALPEGFPRPAMPGEAGGTGVAPPRCPSAEAPLVSVLEAADPGMKFWSLVPWGFP